MSDNKIVTIAMPAQGPRFGVLAPADYAEVMGVVAAYGRLYDDGRIDDFADLLTDDAVYYPNRPGVAPDVVTGKENLRAFFATARAHCDATGILPRHYATNVIIANASADSAEVTVSMLYAESAPGGAVALKMIGQYDYILTKADGRWSIARWSMRYDK